VQCVGAGIDTGSPAAACTCAAGYSGVVTYNATSITGGCFLSSAIVASPAVLDRVTAGAAVTISLQGPTLLRARCACHASVSVCLRL